MNFLTFGLLGALLLSAIDVAISHGRYHWNDGIESDSDEELEPEERVFYARIEFDGSEYYVADIEE